MDRGNLNGLTDEFMKENSKMIKEMVMGYSNGLIKGDMKECGRMESKMVKEDIMI